MQNAELLDNFNAPRDIDIGLGLVHRSQSDEDEDIGFRNATFAWSEEDDDGALTPSSRNFRLRVEGELLFKRGCINLIIGPT